MKKKHSDILYDGETTIGKPNQNTINERIQTSNTEIKIFFISQKILTDLLRHKSKKINSNSIIVYIVWMIRRISFTSIQLNSTGVIWVSDSSLLDLKHKCSCQCERCVSSSKSKINSIRDLKKSWFDTFTRPDLRMSDSHHFRYQTTPLFMTTISLSSLRLKWFVTDLHELFLIFSKSRKFYNDLDWEKGIADHQELERTHDHRVLWHSEEAPNSSLIIIVVSRH